MAIIQLLPEYLANQIAAGEVVQRPDSVVKELVENALDSGATAISVVVRGAGKQAIHVIDNGHGMDQDDLAMCVVRHATSKIRSEKDLHAIATLGFRGEALASIAAVADVEIRTCKSTEPGSTGYKLMSRPGSPPQISTDNVQPGTQILVRNLFYNVPARRKFLKSDLTEFRHISEAMQRVALSRPDVRFTFHDADVLVFDVHPADLHHRTMEILGIEHPQDLVAVHGSEGGITISGFVGTPRMARQSRSGQYLFLNSRPIVSRPLAHAVLSAYEHLLGSGQRPVFVLHIEVDPSHVDVNVHPQKHEVKFEDERQVYLVVQQAVSKALKSLNIIPDYVTDLPLASSPLQSLAGVTDRSAPTFVNRFTGEIHTAGMPAGRFDGIGSGAKAASNRPQWSAEAQSALFDEPAVLPFLQSGGQYIVTTHSDGIMIIDQNAAHQRILYERALSAEKKESAAEQALLFSVRVSLAPAETTVLKEYHEQFTQLGFRVEVIDSTTAEVHAVPSEVQPGTESETIKKMIESLRALGQVPRERRPDGIAHVYAESQAIRRGIRLSSEEMRSMHRSLLGCDVPHLAPDGTPTFIILSNDEIAHRLK